VKNNHTGQNNLHLSKPGLHRNVSLFPLGAQNSQWGYSRDFRHPEIQHSNKKSCSSALLQHQSTVYLYYNIIILIIIIIILLLHYIYKHKLSSPTTTKSEQPCPQCFNICIAWPLRKIKILLGSPSKNYCLLQESVFSKVISFSSLNRKASHLGTYVRSDDFGDDKKYP